VLFRSYLSLPGLLEAAGEAEKYCEACFTGDYAVSFDKETGTDLLDARSDGVRIPVKPLPPTEA